jgi:hypothetical protein
LRLAANAPHPIDAGPNRGFLVAVVIGGIGLIILSIGLGVGISPEVSLLAAR